MTKKDGFLFQVSVAVDGENEEAAWNNFVKDPAKFLPKKSRDTIKVLGVDAERRAVTSYGDTPAPTEKEKAYAEFHGWNLTSRLNAWNREEWTFHKDEILVMGWGRGWAPSHPATGVFDNASWGTAIHAMNVADQMFFGGKKDDIYGWFGLPDGMKPHPARPLPLDED